MSEALDLDRPELRSEPGTVESVPDEIYDTVVSAILDRALDPGTKLPEDVFCHHYGVSRTIVRVAIHRLQQDRLVELQRNKGCFVLVPDRKEAMDILGARKAIEPYVVRRLVDSASEDDLSSLQRHVDREDDAYHRNDQREALRLSGQFHLLLSSIAGNNVIQTTLLNLVCRSALVIATYSDVTACCKAHDHRRLVDLLQKRDAVAAVEQMERHLNDIERDLLQDKPAEAKPSLESVLQRYGPTARLRPLRPID
ncbi:DNA-binding transcriptional regulator, GntR family [Kaistia soli DSM 19436]|uniref:DNA-binding transcriptional regulator, GntR family n=1 Tax=Kaistia soli DSM 19436 TaxID=1122133 RepID=A0A1M5J6S1_9HYPH|nr:GntR family transcriptional regulator [Kaistia soli]SHG36055.1 DNA-binding transcriptional regulator, GntR family [Kaistia soli DSM 19436]